MQPKCAQKMDVNTLRDLIAHLVSILIYFSYSTFSANSGCVRDILDLVSVFKINIATDLPFVSLAYILYVK